MVANAVPGRPEGQGYVTSRVLRKVFGGTVVYGTIGENKQRHCWLEREIDDTAIIIDLTADQMGIGRDFTLALTYKELTDYHRIGEISDEDAMGKSTGEWQRYLLLEKRLAEYFCLEDEKKKSSAK